MPRNLPVYTVEECATLGTYFRDIHRDGELFARELPSDIAEWAVAHPEVFLGSPGADVAKLRTWVLEHEYQRARGSG